jgi:hypothetical protein
MSWAPAGPPSRSLMVGPMTNADNKHRDKHCQPNSGCPPGAEPSPQPQQQRDGGDQQQPGSQFKSDRLAHSQRVNADTVNRELP